MTAAREEWTEGIYQDLDYAVYASIPAARFSDLKWMNKTPAHYLAAQLRPPKESDSMTKGQGFHTIALEPELFDQRFAVAPKVKVTNKAGETTWSSDKRLKPVKDAWAELKAQRPEAEIISREVYDDLLYMRDALHGHELISNILSSPGQNELTIVWEDPSTDILCKCRLDAIRNWDGVPVVIDLKSARDASPWGFARAIGDFEYASQAAHYLDGANSTKDMTRRFMWITVESDSGLPVIYEPDWATLEYGRRQLQRWIQTLAECQKTNTWPGYPVGINELSLPEYKFRKEEETHGG